MGAQLLVLKLQRSRYRLEGSLTSPVPTQVVAAFKILTSDPQVKAILVNIFGASSVTPA